MFCLSSGQPASKKVADDLTRYVEAGEQAAEDFIQTRLVDKTVKFQDRMKKLSLHTFKSMALKCSLTSAQKKTVEVRAERNLLGSLLGSLLMLSQHHNISLEQLFEFSLGPIPWSLASADDGLVKTDKAQLMHAVEAITENSDNVTLEKTVNIMDGNALMQSLTHLPQTFEDLAMSIFTCLPKSDTVHFVTDTYLENSIKQLERARRGSASAYIIGGRKTKLPHDFKTFLHNSENKRQLTCFLLKEWQTDRYAQRLQGRNVYFVLESQCICLHSMDGLTVDASPVPELSSNQEEADTRIILHCLYSSQQMPTDVAVVVRSPDTDVFILLMAYSFEIQQPLMFDTGGGNNRRLLDVHKHAAALGHDVACALPAFHAFTGSDCTSAFVRKGKKGPLKLLRNNHNAVQAFLEVGTQANSVSESAALELEKFVCAMYGKPTFSNTDKVRYEIFTV